MNEALVDADIYALEDIFAEGYIFTTPIATTLDQQKRLESVRSGAWRISTLTFPELKI